MSVAVTKVRPLAGPPRARAIATSWSVARRVSPVTMPRIPEIRVGTPDDRGRQPSAELADLPLIRLPPNQQRSQAEQADAGEPGAEADADATSLVVGERGGGSFAPRDGQRLGRSRRSSVFVFLGSGGRRLRRTRG